MNKNERERERERKRGREEGREGEREGEDGRRRKEVNLHILVHACNKNE